MHILIVSQYFWPENFRVNDFARALIARGHEVTVLTGQPNYPDGRVFADYRANPAAFAAYDGARIVRVPIIPRGSSKLMLLLNYLSFVASAGAYALFGLRRERIDAIFVFQTSPITSALPALILRWRKRAPVLMWILDLWPDTLEAIGIVRNKTLLGGVGRLVRFIYRRCDRLLLASKAMADNVPRYGARPEQLRYFPNWPETEFADMAAAPELVPFADKFVVLFAGNIGEAQDFPAIAAAAEILRDEEDIVFAIVGEGRAMPEARALVAEKALEARIAFLGRFPLERMPAFFAGADAMLVSLRKEQVWELTIPGKVQSYMAAGKPLLGMLDGAGAAVIAESGGGLCAPAGDGAALAADIRTMKAMTPAERAAMGTAARDYCAREFDRTTLVAAFEQWVGELTGAAPATMAPPG